MYSRNNLLNMMQMFVGSDPNALMKVQDMMDILYILNRIQQNSYDASYARRMNEMTPAAKAGTMIRGLASNMDRDAQRGAENFIGILQNMEAMKNTLGSSSRQQPAAAAYRGPTGNSSLEKIKNFLRSLND